MRNLGLICFLSSLICFSLNAEATCERTDEAIAYEDLIQEPLILSESELEVHSETAVSSQADADALEVQPVQRNTSKQSPSYKGGAQDALKRSDRPRVTHRQAPESKSSNVVEEKQSPNTLHERSAIVDDFAEQEEPTIQQQAQSEITSPQASIDARSQKLDPMRNPRVRLKSAQQPAQEQEEIAAPQAPTEPYQAPSQHRSVPKMRQASRSSVQTQEKPQASPQQQQSVQTEKKQEQKPRVQLQAKPRQQRTSPTLRQAPRQSVQSEEKQEAPRSHYQTQPRQQRTSPTPRQAPRQSVQSEEKQEPSRGQPRQQRLSPTLRQAPRQSVQSEEKRESQGSQRQTQSRQQRTSPTTTQNSSRNSVYKEERQQHHHHRESASTEEGESKALSYRYAPNRIVLISNASSDSQKRAPTFFERQTPAVKENATVPPSAKLSRKERTQALRDQAAAPKVTKKQEAQSSEPSQSKQDRSLRKEPPSQLQRSTNRVAERGTLKEEKAEPKQSNRSKTSKSYHLGRRSTE